MRNPITVTLMRHIFTSISGDKVWLDTTNKDGYQQRTEPGLAGVKVELLQENGKGVAEVNRCCSEIDAKQSSLNNPNSGQTCFFMIWT